MLATAVDPRSGLPRGPDWAYEVKWDGMRVLSDVADDPAGSRLVLRSRTGRDVTVAFPELAPLVDLGDALLDGEVVALADGVPSFAALADRMHVADAGRARRLAVQRPVALVLFDVLRLHGVDVSGRPFDERRGVLERLALPEAPVSLSPVYDDGEALVAATREQGLEGVVAKRRSSTYQPGRRSRDWVKLPHRRTASLLVGGWRSESTGGPRVGSLLLGVPARPGDASALAFRGRAGSGITAALADRLAELLAPLAQDRSPFDAPLPRLDSAGARWVRPEVVVDVRYLELTTAGRLRQPVVRGLRDDVAPEEVVDP